MTDTYVKKTYDRWGIYVIIMLKPNRFAPLTGGFDYIIMN